LGLFCPAPSEPAEPFAQQSAPKLNEWQWHRERRVWPRSGKATSGADILPFVEVVQESTSVFVSACSLLNQGVFNEVLNLQHEAGDEQTRDLIGIEMLHFTTV
jgi:hypothetical protein